jgi:1-acyl-sn-glycerol-3-phosphate acyltransferase
VVKRGTFFYQFAGVLVRSVARFLLWGEFRGREHVPCTGPVLLMANHCSTVDPPLVGVACPRKLYYMAKAELFEVPGLKQLIRALNAYPVRRGAPDRMALRRTFHLLEQGEAVLIFPEGTRSRDGRLKEAEPGAVLFALRTGVPVVPVAIAGTEVLWPRDRRLPRWHPVSVRFGAPLRFPAWSGPIPKSVLRRAGRCIMGAIAELLEAERTALAQRFGRYPLFKGR